MEPEAACHLCGARLGTDPLAWSLEREDGETRWLCPACARAHARDIETRLPREWWS